MANYNVMPGPSTGASANESIVMDFGSGQFPNSSMGVFDPDLAFDESVLYDHPPRVRNLLLS